MNNQEYPAGIDCVWLAVDRNRHVGVFVTGGVGPIPYAVLGCDLVAIEDIESLICDLPEISKAYLWVTMTRPDDFVEMAERGFFVYDWRDLHRSENEYSNSYEPIATPISPISVDALPHLLASIALNAEFNELEFSDNFRLEKSMIEKTK